MKKYLIRLFIIIAVFQIHPVVAKTIQVESLEYLSTENPPCELSVRFLDSITFDDDFRLYEGLIVKGKITDVKDPKRLKRDAKFSFIPISYINCSGEEFIITNHYRAKYTTQLDKGQLAKSAALGVGGYFVKGLSQGYSLVEGMVKNQEGNRIKSGVVSVYKNSPLSYVEKGEDLVIEPNEVFILNFKLKSDEEIESEYEAKNKPNYEYTIIEDTESE